MSIKNQLKKGLRALRIWTTLFSLLFFLWWDGREWSYLWGYSNSKKSYRQKLRAEWLTKELIELGSAFIKLGQLLSARPDVLPTAWVSELATLQDKVPPFDFKKVQEILKDELKDLCKEISYLEEEPIGAASLAQVHKATLKNGRKVVFKIQRPGLENLFRLDLSVMEQVALVVQKNKNFSKGRDWVGIAKECRRVLVRELDFQIESQYAARFKQQFLDNPNIIIPGVIWNLSTKKVICLEYIPGIKINDINSLRKQNIDTSKIIEIGASSYLQQLIEFGFFHADPHPGNLAVGNNGSLIYYDFGMMGFISKRIRDRLSSMIKAAALGDASGLVKELQIAGLLDSDIEIGPVRRLIRVMLKETLTPPFNSNIIEKLSGDLSELVYGRPFRIPIELIFVMRALSTFEGVGRNLDPSFNLIAIAKPYLLPLMTGENSSKNANELFNVLGRQVGEIGSKAVGLPKRLDESLEKLEQGDLQLQIRMGESDRQLRRMINAQQSMGQSILLGCLGITSALLISSKNQSLSLIPIILSCPIAFSWIKLQLKMRNSSRLDKFQERRVR